MEAIEIYNYISMEHIDHSKNKFTEVRFKNGVVWNGYLLKADQNMNESLLTNKWNYRIITGDFKELNGADIARLKVG